MDRPDVNDYHRGCRGLDHQLLAADMIRYADWLEQKNEELKNALIKNNLVVSDESFDDMMSHEDDEPNDKLKELMSDTTKE